MHYTTNLHDSTKLTELQTRTAKQQSLSFVLFGCSQLRQSYSQTFVSYLHIVLDVVYQMSLHEKDNSQIARTFVIDTVAKAISVPTLLRGAQKYQRYSEG